MAAAAVVKAFLVCVFIIVLTQGLAYLTEPPDSTNVALAAAACLAIQWVAFVPAAIFQTEKFFDAVGSLTYLTVTISSLARLKATHEGPSQRQIALSSCVLLWAVRLGSFLIGRIHKAGKDGRFDEIKVNPARWFSVWNIQGIWTFLTAMPVFVANAGLDTAPLGTRDLIGFSIWALGMLFEVVADRQKSAFNADPANKGKWITVGLWRNSRHPNYFGEVTLWTGAFIVASSTFTTQAQWVCAISPVFVFFLLSKISGVPLLEKRANEKWGANADYQFYKMQTSVMIPLPLAKGDREAALKAAKDAETKVALTEA